MPLATGVVAPWRAPALLLAGLLALRLRGRWAAVVVFAGCAPVWASVHEGGWGALHGGLLALAALVGGASRSRARLALSGLVAAVALLLAARQWWLPGPGTLPWGLACVGGLTALGALSWPDRRGAGWAPVLAGLVLLAEGQLWLLRLADLPVDDQLSALEHRDAPAGWRLLQGRLVDALEGEPDPGALGVAARMVGRRPWEREPGLSLAQASGYDAAVAAGWLPSERLENEQALQAALSLVAAGERGRALWLLRQHPREGELAFWLALLAWEDGNEALAHHAFVRSAAPPGIPRAPGVLVDGAQLLTDGAIEQVFTASDPVTALGVSARGEAWEGLPALTLVLAGRILATVEVPPEGGQWRLETALPPGAYRLWLRYDNDAMGVGGDRNLRDIRVEAF